MVSYTAEAAAERATELRDGVRPFSNDAVRWPGTVELVATVAAALPRVAVCARACDERFGAEGPDRFYTLLSHVAFISDRGLLLPSRHHEALVLANELARKVDDILGGLDSLQATSQREARSLRGAIIAEAEKHHKRLELLAAAAERLGDEHPDDWAWDL